MPALFETYKARAEAVSAEVHRFVRRADALTFILAFLREQTAAGVHPSRTVWVGGNFLAGVDRSHLLEQTPGLTFDVTRDAAEAANVGICEVEGAISETGTLVTDASSVERRLASTLPQIHVAIAATDSIQADMASAFARVHPHQCAYISLITGPSRTADIERVLTIGVHGPSRLVIIFVDELGRN
jgi:L-lactate dehydrogenase complex protein LldG